MKLSTQGMIFGAIQGLAILVLGGMFLGFVAKHAADRKGVAYVHVSRPDVDVAIDDFVYHVETLESTPIVHELGAGRHFLTMSRAGVIVFEQEFTLGWGEEIVLAAAEAHPSEIVASPPKGLPLVLRESEVPPVRETQTTRQPAH